MNRLIIPTLALALLLFAAGRIIAPRLSGRRRRAIFVAGSFLLGIPGVLMAVYYLHILDDARWFYELRSLRYAELTAAGAGLFAGVLAGLCRRIRRVPDPFLFAALCIGIAVPYVKPLLAPVQQGRFTDRWENGVCLQSTRSSCGAACAATILQLYGFEASEEGIARECFTYLGGTENWYLARALRGRGLTVRYRIENGLPADLRAPAIAGVRKSGWGHFIVVLSRDDAGGYVTGDPLAGRRKYAGGTIASAYTFTGFFMEVAVGGSTNRGP